MPGIGSAIGMQGAVSGSLGVGGRPKIDSQSPPPMKTLVYNPAARIIIARGNRQYDVSSDLVNGGVVRPIDAAASLQFTLNNRDLRYNGLFDRMDRVILFLKRIKTIQVFSGYLDDCPYLQLYPGTVTFRATCTMKRLKYTWWDPSLAESMALFGTGSGNPSTQVQGDGTTVPGVKPIGSILRDVLVNVGGWDQDKIIIENFPMKFMNLVRNWQAQNMAHDEGKVQAFLQQLLGDDHSMGGGASASANPALTLGPQVIGAPNYIATMINICDQLGWGPNTNDMQHAQQMQQAAAAGQSNTPGAASASTAFKGIETAAQSWQGTYRNSDAAILALACAMGENPPVPRVMANSAVEGSEQILHDGIATSGTGVGLYNQTTGGQWGDVAQRMNPEASTRAFYMALGRIDWRNMDPAAAIQAVQGSAIPGKYAPYIQPATAAIQAARGPATDIGAALGSTATANNPLSPAGLISTGQAAAGLLPSVGTTPGGTNPNSLSALAGAAKPNPDAMSAIVAGMSYIGSPYDQIRPPVRGRGVDCSGLTSLAYKSIGIDIGGNTYSQLAQLRGRETTPDRLQPGDLIFPHEGHTFMWLGNAGVPGGPNMILESSGSGWTGNGPSPDGPRVKVNHYNMSSMLAMFHVADFGGWDPSVKFNEPALMGPGYAPGSFGTATSGTGSSAGGGSTEPIARNLFTYQFNYPAYAPKIAALFDGERSLINCEPLINVVQMLCKATMRSWCSSPKGDFVAWYPDYFGLEGKQAVMRLEDIELKDVTINLNDYSLITHAYVAAQTSGGGEPISPLGWLQSGVATVENENLFQQMARISPQLGEEAMTGRDILTRFGARPFLQEYTMVASPELRQLLAIHHFMQGWANQFSSNAQFCFLPELFPGMRIEFVGHNLQVYVTQVEHSFDYQNGFKTYATITAPSVPRGVQSQLNQLQSLSPAVLLEKASELLSMIGMG